MASSDIMLIETQRWLKTTYETNPKFNIPIKLGETSRGDTIRALIQALQIELNVSTDAIWGVGTTTAFNNLFPNGLSENTELSDTTKLKNIIYIIQGGFYTARGINPGSLNGIFSEALSNALKTFQEQIGIAQTGIVNGTLMKALLTTDGYELSSNGNATVREIQQALNKKYYEEIGIIPTNGIYDRQTNTALIKAIQIELGVDADGLWGETTMSALPILRRYGTVTNRQIVYILQYLLYLNGYNPNGFDGSYGGGVESAVKQCQTDYCLTVDGVCGRQTWAALFVSCGDQSRNATACDTATTITKERALTLKNNGYKLVGRYLVNVLGGRNKKIQDGELNNIFDAGLQVFPIFQESNSSKGDFKYDTGVNHGLKAISAAQSYGFKEDTVIFFAVDVDLYEQDVIDYVIPYFQGIHTAMNSQNNIYKVGVYGPRQTCTILKNNNLSDYAFVADSSYRYAGNVAQKIPTDWCYDQFATDRAISDFYIDKVTDRGTLPGVSSVNTEKKDRNSYLYTILKELYDFATNFYTDKYNKTPSIEDTNKLVLQALRYQEYDGILWDAAVEPLNKDYIEELQRTFRADILKSLTVYISEIDGYIGIEHLAIVAESRICNKNFLNSPLKKDLLNLTGTIGDLLQLGGAIQRVYNSDNTKHFTGTDVMFLVGCSSDEVAQEYGFKNKYATGFPVDDLYQDIDGMNIGRICLLDPIYTEVPKYYNNTNINGFNNCEFRFKAYCVDLEMMQLDTTGFDNIMKHIFNYAYYYTSAKDYFDGLFDSEILVNAFKAVFGSFDPDRFGLALADGFAKKIASDITS